MPTRQVSVHLTPHLVEPACLRGCIAVAIDVLRATTTIVHALAAGCVSVRPCAEIEEAKALAASFPQGSALLAGERGGKPLEGFELTNSPRECTTKRCKDKTLVLTTTNGTRAILRASAAERVLIAAFVNFSAVCEQLEPDARPVHILCAGSAGEPCVEDTLLAGALVDFFCEAMDVHLNDSARLAWDCFENNGRVLLGTLQISEAGKRLTKDGNAADVSVCAEVDRFAIVPELRRDPCRIEVASAGIVKRHWTK
jgi:2-phosphosulfolactate phosphatase